MENLKTSLIIGFGEVGKGLHKIIGGDVLDLHTNDASLKKYDIIHICFPFSKNFTKAVLDYKKKYKPKVVVIHSTVPIGTSDICEAVHSPIRGVHPELSKGIKTFVKYIGGNNAKLAASFFEGCKIKTKVFPNAKTTEAIKLWDTTQYGWMIILEKEIYKWCKENNLDFENIYRQSNIDYNEGYIKLKRTEVIRPYLRHMDGPIGGHCVIPNSKLLDSKISKIILKYNKSIN